MQKNQLVIYHDKTTSSDTDHSNNNNIGKHYILSNFTILGNVVPTSWYYIITLSNTKPDQIGITILSELLTQHDISGKLKFSMSYKYFKKKFNLTRIQVRSAIIRLEKKNLIKRDFETVEEQGRKMPNQMFLSLNIDKLKSIL